MRPRTRINPLELIAEGVIKLVKFLGKFIVGVLKSWMA